MRDIDCGDSSCMFAKSKKGMRTNGGCRCLDHAGFSGGVVRAARQMLPELLDLRDRVKQLEYQLEDLEQQLEDSYIPTKVGQRTD